jgi:hypothetical protein
LARSEDLSLLEFKAVQYTPKGNAFADENQLARIAKVPKTGIHCVAESISAH